MNSDKNGELNENEASLKLKIPKPITNQAAKMRNV